MPCGRACEVGERKKQEPNVLPYSQNGKRWPGAPRFQLDANFAYCEVCLCGSSAERRFEKRPPKSHEDYDEKEWQK